MTLGCTDVWGTATLEAEKILTTISISIGVGMNRTAAKREQPNDASSVRKRIVNFNPDSALQCAFRKHASGSR
jgi:hypothetical protein